MIILASSGMLLPQLGTLSLTKHQWVNMAVSTTVLDSGTTSSTASVNTASITPVANTMTIVAVYSQKGSGGGNIPTVSGDGITWTQISNEQTASPGGYNMVTLFGGVSASPSSGALTIAHGGQSQQTISWAVIQLIKLMPQGLMGQTLSFKQQ